jgi:glycosyltransferase involved in cell wall biosynthesis
LEIIVVEDGTETELKEWIESEFSSVEYIRHEENQGLGAARNTGLDRAKGEYIAYLDDDDEWKPSRISVEVEALSSLPEERIERVGVVYCGTENRTPDGETVSYASPENDGNLADSIRKNGASTLPSTFLFRKDALQSVGGFDESLPSSIDHDIWMELATHGYHAVTVDKPLVITYVSPENEAMTSNTIPRIYGVKLFVEKWESTYREWFGSEEGARYAEHYFADVITRLAAKNLQSRSLFEFGQSICAIFSVCTDTKYAIKAIFWRCIAPFTVSPLPDLLVEQLKKIRDTIQ